MEPHIQAIEDFSQILNEASESIMHLKDLPEHFKHRAKRALSVLSNSARHAAGLQSTESDEEAFVVKPVTEMFGRSVVPHSKVPVAQVAPTVDLIEDFRKRCAELIDVFKTQSPKQFLDNCSEREIRGVAKQLGMSDVSSSNPERIDLEFVREMKDLLEHNMAQEAANQDASDTRDEAKHDQKTASEDNTLEVQEKPQIAPRKPAGRR